MHPILLTPEQAAAALRVSRTVVYDLISRGPEHGGLASIRIGRCRRIPVSALDEFVERMRAESTAVPS